MATNFTYSPNRGHESGPPPRERTNSRRPSGSRGGSILESSAPSRSTSSKSRNGDVDSAMARLGMDVEQLFESLTSWSIGAVSELDVSDVYVRFGHDFNACAIAFSSFDISMRDLRSVPDDLRSVLEQCLAEDASPDALERFLPRVRDIIADLRRGLQTRHTQFRAMAQGVDQRRGETQDFANSPGSGRQSSWRSASKPRPAMPSPQIPEEELRYGTSPTPPSKSMLPPMRTPSSQLVASARMSLGRRKPSGSIARTGSPSLTFENDGAHAGPGIDARPRKVSAAASFVANDALAELVADTSAMEDYWQSPVPQKASPAPTKRPTSERDQASVNPSSNAVASRPNATPSPDESPPNPPKPLPPVSPDVKRYSLIDKPVESQTESLGSYPFPDQTPPTSSAPTFSPVSATPTLSSGPAVDSAAPGTPFDPGISSQEPAVENSILALQKSDALERRATKRFSSYTFTKMAGGATGLKQLGFSRNLNRRSIAPSASIGQLSTQDLEALAEVDETKSGSPVLGVGRKGETGSAPVQVKPVLSAPEGARSAIVEGRTASPARQEVNVNLKGLVVRGRSDEAVSRPGTRPSSPRPRPPSIFLQVGRHVKKVQIDPNTPISLSSLRVLFVDKFAYNPGQDNFPAIYIRDAKSGVQYELEDIDEIKNGTLLSLNIEPLDQVKQHIDRQMMALTTEIKDLRSALDAQKRQSLLPQPFVGGSNLAAPVQAVRPTDQQFHVLARRISQLRTGDAKVLPSNINPPKPSLSPLVEQTTGDTYPPLAPETSGTTLNSDNGTTARIAKDLKTQFDEVQNLRRDLGVMRQVYVEFIDQTKESLGTLRTQTANVKELAGAKVGGARAYIDSGKANLDTRSQTVLTKVEELEDMVEKLRDDVVKRRVMPKAIIIKTLSEDIAATNTELQSLKEYIATVQPMWNKTWETELQNIIDEKTFLAHQQKFIDDLIDDYKAVTDIFEQLVAVRNAAGASRESGKGGRAVRTAKQFRPPSPDSGSNGFSTVMLEIRGAQVDSEKRLNAIDANQRARHKELMSRSNEFQEELAGFVSGKKLKKTGGVEETERLRQARNDYTLKNMFSPAAGGVSGGGMVNAGAPGNSGPGFNPGNGNVGAGLGITGVTFGQAPPLDDSDNETDQPTPS